MNDWPLLREPIRRHRTTSRECLLALSAISNHAGSAQKSALDDTSLNGEENAIEKMSDKPVMNVSGARRAADNWACLHR